MINTKIIAASVVLGLAALANPAKASWELNPNDVWTTRGSQTYTENASVYEFKSSPSSSIVCGYANSFYVFLSSVDISLAEPENDGFQSTEISLRVKVDDEPTKAFKFARQVQDDSSYFYPHDPLFLYELRNSARSIQIEYPLTSGRIIHTYSNYGINGTPCNRR